jgi:predicted RNase H-like nuclease (RuvC/YqgF family)
MPRFKFPFFITAIFLFTGFAAAQDSPSLGDLARQQRQHKASDAQDGKTPKVITNEQIPEHPERTALTARNRSVANNSAPTYGEEKQSAEHWKSQITSQKHQVASLQREINDLNESIRFAPANCAANCVGWNERQREKEERVERMRGQLDDEKHRLDDMQETARKQGYGSSVYDP